MNEVMSPRELDNQSTIQIDGWLDIDSEECRYKDTNFQLTKQWLRIGLEDKYLFLDSHGRVWGKGNNEKMYPYHITYGKKIYGIRVAKKASN